MKIRKVTSKDYKEISELIKESFTNTENGYGHEAELVDKIRVSDCYNDELEIIATENEKIIGHGLLSEVNIVNDNQKFKGLVLAPLGVATDYQGKGVGKKILQELENRAEKLNYKFISILGHPSYYTRFGYIPASKYNIKPPFDVLDEVFMIKPLRSNSLNNINGTIRYSRAFE
ncbi:GNAT family N-acetyltransferase [Enterococcus sp. AZ126]|uniref:GNAT family N-acetyltransferase n=1 Tax=Enterococcus sp. AZ126 TaxID=2774635 RepID=UPI003F229733